MCYFVTIATPKRHEAALGALREAGFEVSPSLNAALLQAFGADHAAFDVTRGGCSCDFFVKGPVPGSNDTPAGSRPPRGKRAQGVATRHRFVAGLLALHDAGVPVTLFAHAYRGRIDNARFGAFAAPRALDVDVLRATEALPKDRLVQLVSVRR